MRSDFRSNLYRKDLMVDAYGAAAPKLSVKTDESPAQNGNDFDTKSGTDGTVLNGKWQIKD